MVKLQNRATEALRGAVYAVAAGAVDVAMALGVEKLKDTGFGGLPIRTKSWCRRTTPTIRKSARTGRNTSTP